MNNSQIAEFVSASRLADAPLHAKPNDAGNGGMVFPSAGPAIAIVGTYQLAILFAHAPALLALALSNQAAGDEDVPAVLRDIAEALERAETLI